MIEIKNIEKHFGKNHILKDMSFIFQRGKTNLIIGESGSGKTMIGLSIMALYPEPAARITGGQIKLRTRKKDIQEVNLLFKNIKKKIHL